ncbi:MAG TPA: hypothetical protein VE709_15545 [Pseudonocardiaceae bacterium]|nr:hypothetical protein [Pseudonocardiaceae bacterium]
MDAFGHVNNASLVTLLEVARTELLFGAGAQAGAADLARGVVWPGSRCATGARWCTRGYPGGTTAVGERVAGRVVRPGLRGARRAFG